ncbi:hypothetical protein [Maricaulis parjimensis]|uniref:hypothetical protein n=1 Tax=Maricaulis parjimensis TaxID=144023 RepID=UPI00193A4F0A|nr:hypothetical protein [Maricaulis parjimensis]
MRITYFQGLSAWKIVLLCSSLLLMLVETAYSVWWGIGDILIRAFPGTHPFFKDSMVDLVLGTSLAQDSIYFLATIILTASCIALILRKAWAFWAYAAAALLYNLDWVLMGLNGLDNQPAAGYFSMAYACLLLFLLWLTNRFGVSR